MRTYKGRPIQDMSRMDLELVFGWIQDDLKDAKRIVDDFVNRWPRDEPLPKGLGYSDGLTPAQNEREGERRREARI